jgi:AcrR family transcriptional regulator
MPTADSIARSPRRARRYDGQRMAILRAAGRMFRERGVGDTGMRDIAEAADLSPANLYHYFSGKDEILFFCQHRSLELMLDALARARRDRRATQAERLRAVLRAHAEAVLGEVEGGAAHLAVDALPEPLRARIVTERDRYEHGLRAIVTRGIRRGEFVECDDAVTTRAMLGAVNWTATWFRPEGSRTAAAVADAVAAYLVRGVEKPPASVARSHGNGAGRGKRGQR